MQGIACKKAFLQLPQQWLWSMGNDIIFLLTLFDISLSTNEHISCKWSYFFRFVPKQSQRFFLQRATISGKSDEERSQKKIIIIQIRGGNFTFLRKIPKFSPKTIKSFGKVQFLWRHSANYSANRTKALKIYAKFCDSICDSICDKQVSKTILTFDSAVLVDSTQKLCTN